VDGKGTPIGDVDVYVRIGPPLLQQILNGTSRPDNIELALVAGGHAVASSNNAVGPVSGLRAGAGYATVAGTDVRATAITIPASQGNPAYIVATYQRSPLSHPI